jgi:hypothetical protein
MERLDIVLNLASDLQGLLDERIGDEAILETYFTGPIHPDLKEIKENIGQYLDDRVRREEDEEYRQMQENEMRTLIHLLRLSKIEQAKKINFLYETDIEY